MAAKAPFYDVGLYVGEIISQDISTTTKGNKQLVWRVKILGIPQGDSYAPNKQQYERTIYWVVTPDTKDFIAEKLAKLGFEGAPSQWHPDHPSHISLVGNQVDLWCKHEQRLDGNGWTEKWDVSNGSGGSRVSEPLSGAEARKLDMMFGKAASTQPRAAQTSRTSTAALAQKHAKPAEQKPVDFENGEKANFGFQTNENPPAETYADEGITDDDIPF